MEDYLETLITIMIGLGAFLISALRKKRPKEEKSDSVSDNWFEEKYSPDEEQLTEEEIVYDELESSENQIFEDYKQNDSELIKQTAMRETTSINDPPGHTFIGQKIFEKEEREIYNLKEQKKAKKKVKFDGKKAIIYSTIINRKQF